MKLYTRVSNNVFFIFPSLAIGIDLDGTFFFEFAWFFFAFGISPT